MHRLDAIPVTFDSWVQCYVLNYYILYKSACKFHSVKPIMYVNRTAFFFLSFLSGIFPKNKE